MSASSLICRNDALLAGPLGSFEAYAERVSRIPVLTADERPSSRTASTTRTISPPPATLVLSHLRFVLHIARGYTGYGLPMGDLVQEGNVGLMKAGEALQSGHERAAGVVRGALDPCRDP